MLLPDYSPSLITTLLYYMYLDQILPKAIKIEYVTTKVPKDLKENIESFLNDNSKLGYTSFMAFVNDALREKFENEKRKLTDELSLDEIIAEQERLVSSPEYQKEQKELAELPKRVSDLERKVDQILTLLKDPEKIKKISD